MQLTAATTLQDLGTLVLGDHALDLQQQVFLGGMADVAVEEDDLDTTTLQLIE